MDQGKDHKPHAGEDYKPSGSEGGYKSLINVHTNHSNLEGGGFYDPRRDLNKTLELESEEEMRRARAGRARALALGVLVIVVLIVSLALFLSRILS